MSIRAFLQSRLEGLSISSSIFGVGPKSFFDLIRVANLVDEHIKYFPMSVSCINGGDIDEPNFLLTENGIFGKFSDLCNLANEIIGVVVNRMRQGPLQFLLQIFYTIPKLLLPHLYIWFVPSPANL